MQFSLGFAPHPKASLYTWHKTIKTKLVWNTVRNYELCWPTCCPAVFITQSPEHTPPCVNAECRSMAGSTSLTASVCGRDPSDLCLNRDFLVWTLNHEQTCGCGHQQNGISPDLFSCSWQHLDTSKVNSICKNTYSLFDSH